MPECKSRTDPGGPKRADFRWMPRREGAVKIGSMSPLLLIVSGLPASGKTTLASHLARELRLPLVTKDEYKQLLCDGLPELPNSAAGPLSFSLLWHGAGVTLAAGVDTLLETHFYRPQSEGEVLRLAERHHARLAQVFCHAPLPELKARHAARVASGVRPRIDFPFDHEDLPPSACWEPLELGDVPLLRLDTTREDAHAQATAWVRGFLV